MTKTISVRMDEKVKKEFETWCKSVGMNVSTAMNLFAKEVLRKRRLPFMVSDDPFYDEENMKHLEKSIKSLNEGKVVVKTMKELEEMANG